MHHPRDPQGIATAGDSQPCQSGGRRIYCLIVSSGPPTTRAYLKPRTGTPEPAYDAEAEYDELVSTISSRLPGADCEAIRRAYEVARDAHADQRRKTGAPYISHPLSVARILAELVLDPPTVSAALLHDTLEDTNLEKTDLEEQFGDEVAHLVVGVTKISALEAHEKVSAEAESLRRMFLAAVDDPRVMLIKLADRLHNMRTVRALSPPRRRELAAETLEIYAPLANRLGIWQLKSELEDLALSELEPETYAAIARDLADRRAEHEEYLHDVIEQLEARLRETGIEPRITSRTKHYFSIFQKMRRKEVEPSEVLDVLAVRVLVDQTEQCYSALGTVHTMWPPVEGEFDDYIAKPKNNLYQSLHTTVLGPGNRPLEVQIRTFDMHEVAEHGVAAHWQYKEKGPQARQVEAKIASLRALLASQDEDAPDAEAYVASLKTDVFRDQVYVFTPQGEVLELPAGSTPVDFAYHIHTEVGHRCRGALVDGKIVSLDTPLRTGQSVKIATAKGDAGPSRDWLNPALGFVASSRAKAKIAQWFRRQARETAVREGREVLERQLRKLGLTRVSHSEVARLFGYDKLEDFFAATGRSEIPSEAISSRLLEQEEERSERAASAPDMEADAALRHGPGLALGVTMRGADGVFTRVAKCCRPLPGEKVIGYITRSRGVTLHRADCPNISAHRAREPERFIQVDWQKIHRQTYPVELHVVAYDRPGLLRDLSDVIAQRGINMRAISAGSSPGSATALVTAIVEIASHRELTGLIDKLGTVDNVIEVRRPTG